MTIDLGIPYQTLINLYLSNRASKNLFYVIFLCVGSVCLLVAGAVGLTGIEATLMVRIGSLGAGFL